MGRRALSSDGGHSLAPFHRTAGSARRRRPAGSRACRAGRDEHEPDQAHQQHARLGHAERPGRVRSRQRPAHLLGLPGHAQLQGARRRHRGGHATRRAPSYGKYLTPDQFRARYAPTDADVAAVRAYLKQAGFAVSADRPDNNRWVKASGTTAQVEQAFNDAAAHLPAPRQDAAGAQRRPERRALDLEPHRGHRRPRRQRPAHAARHRRRASVAGLRQRAAVLDLLGREDRGRRQAATRRSRPPTASSSCRTRRAATRPTSCRAPTAPRRPSPAASTATARRWRSSTPSPRRRSSRTPTSTRRPTASRRWTSARSSPRIAPTIRSAGPTSATRRAGTARRPSTSRPCTPWRPAPTCSSWAAPTASTSRSSTRSTRSSTAAWPRSSRTPTATSARPARTPACARPGTTPSARPPWRASGCTSRRATAATRSTTSATPRPTSRPRTRSSPPWAAPRWAWAAATATCSRPAGARRAAR